MLAAFVSQLGMQQVALVLLVLYLAAAVVLLPRELVFLREVAQPRRSWFIVQDALLQLSILAVLVPSASAPRLDLTRMVIVLAGFTLLWIVAIWMSLARQTYVHHLLREARRESEQQLQRVKQKLEDEREDGPSDNSNA